MLSALRNYLPTLLMPLTISLVLIAIGLARRRRSAIAAGLLLLYLASVPAISDSLRGALENRYPRVQPADCPAADALVVLSGFAAQGRRHPGEIQWTDKVDRFEKALQLFRLQKAPIILFTDPKPGGLGKLVAQAAVEQGIPANAVVLTGPVSTTADEAGAVREYLRANPGQHIILVTSAIHMPRAASAFRRAGIRFTPFPVGYQSDGWEWRLSRFWPSPGALAQTEQCLHEIYGNLIYGFL